jgi:intracellular septation protein A
MALGAGQIGWQLLRKKPVETLQWMSVCLVLASGTATLFTNDPHFVMLKPSLIYVAVGAVMLRPGWLNRYLPPRAVIVTDIATIFGFVWATLMFASAGLNLWLALTLDAKSWAATMSAWGIVSKLALFGVQYTIMTRIGMRRARAMMAAAATPT